MEAPVEFQTAGGRLGTVRMQKVMFRSNACAVGASLTGEAIYRVDFSLQLSIGEWNGLLGYASPPEQRPIVIGTFIQRCFKLGKAKSVTHEPYANHVVHKREKCSVGVTMV
ncbi:hypothetical protein J4Q44_G00268420 [Coregonus suidteri]|uniref:Uncharacterized protein n=1 Tax=Coregonus suidteri TaxID=861788 RepID=A0AAN8L4F8_9TELE